MKLAYLSVFADGTGFSNYAIDTALSLDAAGVDVVCRNIKLATQTVEPPQRIQELLNGSTEGITHVVQHILAPYFSYRAGFKNIGFAHFETTHFTPSNWQYYCNLMDELWVSSEQNVDAARRSGVKVPISIVPRGLCVEKYNETLYEKNQFGINGRYCFYHIGDFSARKNTLNLIRCYFECFSKQDNVVLVLKSYVEGVNPQESTRIIHEEIQGLKKSMRRWGMDMYPAVVVISDYLDDKSVMALHAAADCFVSLERGSAWTIPAQDAIAFGKWVILNGWGGHTAYVKPDINGHLTTYSMDTVRGMIRTPYPNIYTCWEEWAEPNYNEFKLYMKRCYKEQLNNKFAQQSFLKENSYKAVGEKIKELL